MNPNMSALQALVALIAAAVKDTENAVKPGQSMLGRLLDYQDLVPKLLAFIPQAQAISLAGLQPSDYISLAEALVADMAISNAHAKGIIDAAFKLVMDANQYMLPDVEALVAAIKAPAAA